uniref:Uncharacterized protein n=1 Tax=Skeletonema marinoi TaxID=267567 RepID=A0A6U3XLB4_9STRA|mmetsp:Transcript_30723/g.52182  ORF Transcript_30723/g.52182 Transcript_30723/m.52182 type:complete len:101 (+) Transcript_30723:128-430(+)
MADDNNKTTTNTATAEFMRGRRMSAVTLSREDSSSLKIPAAAQNKNNGESEHYWQLFAYSSQRGLPVLGSTFTSRCRCCQNYSFSFNESCTISITNKAQL